MNAGREISLGKARLEPIGGFQEWREERSIKRAPDVWSARIATSTHAGRNKATLLALRAARLLGQGLKHWADLVAELDEPKVQAPPEYVFAEYLKA